MEVKNVIDTFLSVAQVHQDQTLHVATEKREKQCFHHAMEHDVRHFGEEQAADKKSHLLNSYFGIQHHFEDLKHALLHMNRENEHFMWDHRTKQYSTILVAATIMISALVAALGQGVLHEDSPDLVVIVYSVTTSLSLAFLFICDVLCIEVIRRGSSFMRHRMSSYRRSLTSAIRKTKEMVHTLRGIDPNHAMDRQHATDEDGNIPLRTHQKLSKTITHMTDEEVDKEFFAHETDIQRHHDTEATIIESSFPIANGLTVTQTFEDFWQENCHTYGLTIILLFYSGSIMMIFANLCFMWATYEFKYQSLRGSEVCLHTVTNVVLVICIIILYMRYEQLDLDCITASHNHDSVGLEDYSWGSIDFVTLKASIFLRIREVCSSFSSWFMNHIRWWEWSHERPENVSLSSKARGYGAQPGGYGSIELPAYRPRGRSTASSSSARANRNHHHHQQQQYQNPQRSAYEYSAIPTTEGTNGGTTNGGTTSGANSGPTGLSISSTRRNHQVEDTKGPFIRHDHPACDPVNVNLLTSFTSLQPPASTNRTAATPHSTTNSSIVPSSSSSSSSSTSRYPLIPSHNDNYQHPGSSGDHIISPAPLPFPSLPYDQTMRTSASATSSTSYAKSSSSSSSSSSRESNQQRVYRDYANTNRQPSTDLSLSEGPLPAILSSTRTTTAATAAAAHEENSMDNFPPNNAYEEEVTYSITTINKQRVTVKRTASAPSSTINPTNITTLSSGHHLSALTPQHHNYQQVLVDDDYDHAEVSSEASSNFSRGSSKEGLLWSAVKMPIHPSHRVTKSNRYQSTTTPPLPVSQTRGKGRANSTEDNDDWGAQFLFN